MYDLRCHNHNTVQLPVEIQLLDDNQFQVQVQTDNNNMDSKHSNDAYDSFESVQSF